MTRPTNPISDPTRKLVSSEERERHLNQRGVTVWLTGLSGSGKSTIARAFERHLADQGHLAYVLDGDLLRQGLNKDLGFSPEDRTENVRRTAEVARIMNDAGLIAIVALISPSREHRALARSLVAPERFLEVHVSTPLSVCRERDPKSLYAQVQNGQISQFSGVTAPYEEPETPDLRVDTSEVAVEAAVASLARLLGGIPASQATK
jgi:adenylylsulfate kinase